MVFLWLMTLFSTLGRICHFCTEKYYFVFILEKSSVLPPKGKEDPLCALKMKDDVLWGVNGHLPTCRCFSFVRSSSLWAHLPAAGTTAHVLREPCLLPASMLFWIIVFALLFPSLLLCSSELLLNQWPIFMKCDDTIVTTEMHTWHRYTIMPVRRRKYSKQGELCPVNCTWANWRATGANWPISSRPDMNKL